MAEKTYYCVQKGVSLNGEAFAEGVYVASLHPAITPGDLVSAVRMGHVALDPDAKDPVLGLHSDSDELKQLAAQRDKLAGQVKKLTAQLAAAKSKPKK